MQTSAVDMKKEIMKYKLPPPPKKKNYHTNFHHNKANKTYAQH